MNVAPRPITPSTTESMTSPAADGTAGPSRRTTLGLGAAVLGSAAAFAGVPPAPASSAGTEVPDAGAVPGERPDPPTLTTIPAVREFTPDSGQFRWSGGIVVTPGQEELAAIGDTLAADIEHLMGTRPEIITGQSASKGSLLLVLGDQGHGPESYSLDIGSSLTITGTSPHGVFNGTRTVLQLLTQGETVPGGSVTDWPDKEVRSALIDNTPKHFSLGVWETLLRHMSYAKLNDTNLYVDGVGLSLEEMQQIDEIAARYYIDVVPQLNMPAHMNQVLPAHPEYQLVNSDDSKNPTALDLTNPEAVQWALGRLEDYLEVFRSSEWHLGSDEFPGWPGTGENHPQLDAYAQERFGPEATFADLFADFQNQANHLVKSHGKTMRVWNDMIRESSVVQLDADVTVEYWIQHDALPGLLSPTAIAERGNSLINAHVDFLYYDQSQRNLDPQLMYEEFTTTLFPFRNEVPGEVVRGARIAVWLAFIGTPIESDAEVISNLVPSLNVLGQLTWGSEPIAEDYAAFRDVQAAVGCAPGAEWLGTGDFTKNPQAVRNSDGTVAFVARTTDGALITGKHSRPGRTHWSAREVATNIEGDVEITNLSDGRWRAAARAVRGLVIATQSDLDSEDFDVVEHSMPLDADPALAGEAVIISSRSALLLVDPGSGDTTRLGAPARGAVSAGHHDGVMAAAANSPQGVLVIRGSGDSWAAVHADRLLPDPQVLVSGDGVWVIGVDEDGTLLAGEAREGSVTWEEVGTGATGRPAVALAPDGTMHIASLHDSGEIHLHRYTDEDWATEIPLTDMRGDPVIGFTADGDVRVLGHAVRETLRMAQSGTDGWEVAELAESTAGRPSLARDDHGWPIYVTATAYGDLQTGTQWGDGASDWGRDFIVGTMSTPGDRLHPQEFGTRKYADDFTAGSGQYGTLPADPDLPSPEPTIGDGRLALIADGGFSSLVVSEAALGEDDEVVVAAVETLPLPGEPAAIAGMGIARDAENYGLAWVSPEGRLGFEIRSGGHLTDVGADIPRVIESGDRIAVTISGKWMMAWVERHGIWDRAHAQLLNVAEDVTDPAVRTLYRAALALRGDGGRVAFSSLEVFAR